MTLINTMASGLPINLNYALSSSSSLYVSDIVTFRPNKSGSARGANLVKTATSLNGYLDGANLSIPTTYPWGTASRNSERGPAFYQTDLGLHKAFPLWNDSSNLDFRAEAFNLLNKVNYTTPNSTFAVGSTSFGAITGNYPARQLQLAAKFIF